MMLILTAVISFLSSSLPSLLKYFELKSKLKHELQITTLKLEASIRNVDADKEVEKARAEVQDVINARENDDLTHVPGWIEVVRALIRPLVTFLFVGLYVWFKVATMVVLIRNGLTIDNMEIASKIILDETTVTVIMIVIGFYFGSRTNFHQSKS